MVFFCFFYVDDYLLAFATDSQHCVIAKERVKRHDYPFLLRATQINTNPPTLSYAMELAHYTTARIIKATAITKEPTL